MARAGYALSISLRDNSTRSIKGRMPNSRELDRDSSSRDMAFPPRISHLPVPRPSPQGTPEALPYPILGRMSSPSDRRGRRRGMLEGGAAGVVAPKGRLHFLIRLFQRDRS